MSQIESKAIEARALRVSGSETVQSFVRSGERKSSRNTGVVYGTSGVGMQAKRLHTPAGMQRSY